MNKAEILIDILKEDIDELNYKMRSEEEQMKLLKIMIEEVVDLKEQLEAKLSNLLDNK